MLNDTCVCLQDMLVSLSQLLRGSSLDKLQWAFQLYDVNGDGCITKTELSDIVSSIHELMGRTSGPRHVSVFVCLFFMLRVAKLLNESQKVGRL